MFHVEHNKLKQKTPIDTTNNNKHSIYTKQLNSTTIMFHVKPIDNNFILYIIYEQKLISKIFLIKIDKNYFPGNILQKQKYPQKKINNKIIYN